MRQGPAAVNDRTRVMLLSKYGSPAWSWVLLRRVQCLTGPAAGLCPLVIPVGAPGSGSGCGGRLSPLTTYTGCGQVGDDAVGAAAGVAWAGRDVTQPRVRGRCPAGPGRGWSENSSPSLLHWPQFL